MAENVGLRARLSFYGDQAITGMRRAGKAMTRMGMNAKMAKAGVQDLQRSFAGAGLATAGIGYGLVSTVKKFADFEGQMGAVKAVLGKEAEPSFARLEAMAMKLGATTAFTAKQAAEAMENLARAGMQPEQIMSAIGPTLAAAAAEGMDLGTAADIVASNMKAFGLEATDATRIADALAFVSAKTNTNMVSLQEGLKFAAPVAKNMGIELETTAASLGVLANIGLKGTLAGTALKNALLKIAESAKRGQVPVGKYKAQIEMLNKDEVDLAKTMKNIVAQLKKIDDPIKRAQASMDLLGMRGMGAAAAFQALGKDTKTQNLLFDNMQKNAAGTADTMQKMRLDNLHGDVVRLSSAWDGFTNSMGKAFRPIAQEVIAGPNGLITMFGDAAKAFEILSNDAGLGSDEMNRKLGKLNQTAVQFATGFKEGIEGARKVFETFATGFKSAGIFFQKILGPLGILGEEGSGVKGITALTMKLVAFGAAIKVSAIAFRMLRGTGRLMGGLLPVFGRKGGKAGGMGGLLGAAGAAGATPVRVVNFHEAGGLGGGGEFIGPQQQAGGAGGTGFFGRKVGKGMFAGMSKLGKAASMAGTGLSVFGAGLAGFQLGSVLAEALEEGGFYDMIAEQSSAYKEAAARAKENVIKYEKAGFARQAVMFRNLQQAGTQIDIGKGKREQVTRELVIERMQKGILRDKTEAERRVILESLKPILDQIKTSAELQASKPTEVTINVEGKEIAKAIAVTKEETDARRGRKIKPSARRENRS